MTMNMTTMMLTRATSDFFHMPPWPRTREEGILRRRVADLRRKALETPAANVLGFDYGDDGEDDEDASLDDEDWDDFDRDGEDDEDEDRDFNE